MTKQVIVPDIIQISTHVLKKYVVVAYVEVLPVNTNYFNLGDLGVFDRGRTLSLHFCEDVAEKN